MRKNKFKKYIFLLIIPLLFITGISSWIILNNTVFAPSYNPNSTSILFQAFDGQSGTYTKESQGPVSSNDKIKNENVSFSYRKADSNDFYTGGLPINAGTYDILIKDNSKYYVDEVVRYTINKADLSSVDISKLTIMPNVSPLVYGDILEYLGEATANGIKDDSSVPGDVYFYEGETETTSYKLTHTESTTTQVFDKSIKMIFSPSDNYSMNYNSIEFNINVEMSAVAYTGTSNKKYYSTIQNAITSLSGTSGTVYVIPNLGFEIINDENIEIPSGITVSIPYEGTSIKISANEISNMSENYADSDLANRQTLINMINGSDIIINSGGTLKIGGQTGPIGVAGKYTEVNLDEKSSIICEGTIECYGYIKENVNNAKNGLNQLYSNYNDNSYDAERFINIKSGGIFYTNIAMYDMKTVSELLSLNNSGIFPLSIFDFPNIQTYLQIDYGGIFNALCFLNAQGIAVNEELPIISKSNSMFILNEGNMGIEYCPANVTTTSTSSVTRVFVNGNLTQGTAKISVQNETITTDGKFLPLSYKFNIFINNNATYNTSQKIKVLPGGIFKINKGGSAIINNEFICYNGTESSKIEKYYNSSNSILINNGTLTLGENGKIGAYIQTEATDNSACLNFSNSTTDSVFTVTSTEGQDELIVSKTSEGLFVDQSNEGKSIYQFKSGSTVYSDKKGGQCWDGAKYALRTIKLTNGDSSILNPLFSFEINVKDNETSTTYTTTDFGDQNSSKLTFEVADGKYVNINLKRHKSAIFSDGTTFSSTGWYLVSKDMEIIVTPNNGVSIKIVTTMDSGNGQTTFTLYECEKEDGTFYQVGSWEAISNPPEVTALIVENWHFKITYVDGKSLNALYTSQLDSANFTIVSSTNTSATAVRFYSDTVYKADDSYVVTFPRKSSTCVASGTFVTLNDGSYKKVEDIKTGDQVLVFNHLTGNFDTSIVMYNAHDKESWTNVDIINLVFDNGTTVKMINEHAFFNLTLNEYSVFNYENVESFIGHEFFVLEDLNNINKSSAKLIDVYYTTEFTGVYSPVTANGLNCFTDGFLSIAGDFKGFYNIFEFDENQKYDEELMKQDIEKYGLYTYEDFKDYVPEVLFDAYQGQYLKVAIGKGHTTFEEILQLIDKYITDEKLPDDFVNMFPQ